MSKLNINRNIFLEKEELLRWQKFMLESPVNKTFLSNTVLWGIIDTSGELATPVDFKVEAGSTSGTVKIDNLSRALQSEGLIIEQSAIDNIAVPNDSNYYWIKIGHQYSNLEEGTISITADGQISGLGTTFTDILRGQSTEVPVKIKLMSQNNIGIYDVVDVLSDSFALLQGSSFVVENGISFYVIGSTPLGDTVTSQQESGLYYYDSCLITQVLETVTDTEPSGLVSDKEFWIARVTNTGGTVTIEDKRTEYWEYFIRGVSDKLDRNKNLSDLGDAAIARGFSGLDVYSTTEVEEFLNIDDSGWLRMDKGGNIQTTNYNINIRRIGQIVNITGSFKVDRDKGGMGVGDVVCSIPYTTIGTKAKPTNDIYFSIPLYEHDISPTIGVSGIIDASDNSGILKLISDNTSNYPDDFVEIIMNFNLTYIGG